MKAPKHNKTGYYYHYKHDPDGTVNNYAYFIIGGGHHTEKDAPKNEKYMQVYLPLYESAYVYKLGKFCDLRPMRMSMQNVRHNGKIVPRFRRITDTKIIRQLRRQRNKMYPEIFG